MKLKEGYMLTGFADKYIALATDDNADNAKAIVTLNRTGAFAWKLLETEITYEEALGRLTEKYDAPVEALRADFNEFLETLRQHGLLDE